MTNLPCNKMMTWSNENRKAFWRHKSYIMCFFYEFNNKNQNSMSWRHTLTNSFEMSICFCHNFGSKIIYAGRLLKTQYLNKHGCSICKSQWDKCLSFISDPFFLLPPHPTSTKRYASSRSWTFTYIHLHDECNHRDNKYYNDS